MDEFAKAFRPHRVLLIGGEGFPLEEFLLQPAEAWLRK